MSDFNKATGENGDDPTSTGNNPEQASVNSKDVQEAAKNLAGGVGQASSQEKTKNNPWPTASGIDESLGTTRQSAEEPSFAKNGTAKNTLGQAATGCCPLLANHPLFVKQPWRKRHPVLFWFGIILLLLFVYNAGNIKNFYGLASGPKLAVINVDEPILSSDKIVEWIDLVRRDKEVKGAILRVDSPGGSVGSSQEIYFAVKRLAEEKPVVVSMGGMATSGGYYVAMGGHEIFAMPSTLTANIGVRLEIPNFEELMNTIGIGTTILTTGTYKAAGTTSRKMTDEEQAYMQALIDDMHAQFVKVIAENRKMPPEKVAKLADGRAMTGNQALDAGLVDFIGGLSEAKVLLQNRTGLVDTSKFIYIEGPEKEDSFFRELMGVFFDVAVKYKQDTGQAQFYY